MNKLSPHQQRSMQEEIKTSILTILKPCLVYMNLFGLVPYSLDMDLTPLSLLMCILLSVVTVFSVLKYLILDVKFLSVKSFELIPAIILFTYNIILCIYISFNMVQNLRKHDKSRKILLSKLVHIDFLITSRLHLSLTQLNSSLTRSVLFLTLWNMILYASLALVTYSLFRTAPHLLACFFIPMANINAILILLISKISTLRKRFAMLNDVTRGVQTKMNRSGSGHLEHCRAVA